MDGTVACAAGPSAALSGVAGTVTDCGGDIILNWKEGLLVRAEVETDV